MLKKLWVCLVEKVNLMDRNIAWVQELSFKGVFADMYYDKDTDKYFWELGNEFGEGYTVSECVDSFVSWVEGVD